MTAVFLLVPRYDWCAPLLHPSSKEEYKPWKWGATAIYYAPHAKTLLPTKKSMQDPAGKWTTRKPPDHLKETQIAVVWICLLFIRSGQNHLARHSERGKKTRQTKEEMRWQHQGMDRSGVRQVPEGSEKHGKKWRKLGVKSSVASQQLSWLMDRWWWYLMSIT